MEEHSVQCRNVLGGVGVVAEAPQDPRLCYHCVNYAGNGPHLQRTCLDIH